MCKIITSNLQKYDNHVFNEIMHIAGVPVALF